MTDNDDAYDRRIQASRDTAKWVKDALDAQSKQISDIRMSNVVGFQQIETMFKLLEEKVDELRKILLSSVPNGDPEKHLHHHIRLEVKEAEEQEALAESKRFKKDLIRDGKKLAIAIVLGLIGLGLTDWGRNFVLGVNEGKSSMELQKNEPVHRYDKDGK